jgi:protein phosphatase
MVGVGQSDVGRQRQANEDAFKVMNPQRLWLLADGMGGHAAGQIASKMAVEEVSRFMQELLHDPLLTWPFERDLALPLEENALMNALRVANVRIYNRSIKEPKCFGMGTTMVAATLASNNELVIASVGDSRCYRFRRGQLTQLTLDHSLLNHLIYVLKMPPEEAHSKAASNVIIRAVGLEDDVEVDVLRSDVQDGDLFLMCSDGLNDLVSDAQIAEVMSRHAYQLEQMTERLINLANEEGGTDNITVIALRAEEENTPSMFA